MTTHRPDRTLVPVALTLQSPHPFVMHHSSAWPALLSSNEVCTIANCRGQTPNAGRSKPMHRRLFVFLMSSLTLILVALGWVGAQASAQPAATGPGGHTL